MQGKKCSQQQNSIDKLTEHYKLTIAGLWRIVGKTQGEEADVKGIYGCFAGWKDFYSNIKTGKARNNAQKKQCND